MRVSFQRVPPRFQCPSRSEGMSDRKYSYPSTLINTFLLLWATRERSGCVIHMITGGVFENSTRRPSPTPGAAARRCRTRATPADAHTSFTRRAIRLDENFRLAMPVHRFPQRLDAEIRFQGDRHPPCQDPPTEPVHHRDQVHEPFGHRNIRDVGAPDLVRSINDQTP
jgi:hypothetical protein